jgi:hypothetical protein
VKSGRDRNERNPDARVRETLELVFNKFAEVRMPARQRPWGAEPMAV